MDILQDPSKIDWYEVAQRYDEERLSFSEVAAQYNCSEEAVIENLPFGVRVSDLVEYAKDFLRIYRPESLAEDVPIENA